MDKHSNNASDALVDSYRALRAINHPAAVPTGVDGAGPRVTKLRPGKRLRNWHRQDRDHGGKTSLRAYVRRLAAGPACTEQVIAQRWMTGKAGK